MGSQLNIELTHSWCCNCNRSETQFKPVRLLPFRCSLFGSAASSVGRWLGAALTRRPRAAEPPPPAASVGASVTTPLAAAALPLPQTARPLAAAGPQVRDAAKPSGELPVRRRL